MHSWLIVLLGLLAAWVVIAARTVYQEWKSWAPKHSISELPDSGPLIGTGNIFLETDAGRIAAWYLPPRNRVIILLAHGFGGNRQQMSFEAESLAGAGFGVFALDFPGHGESSGKVDPAEDPLVLRQAIDWLKQHQPDGSIGALGFSSGAMAVALAAASDARIEAVVSVSGKTDDWEFAKVMHGRFGWLTIIPGALTATLMGERWSELRPVDVIGQIAPRPVLIVHGAEDETVPTWMAHELFRNAREPKDLWLIEEGNHGELWTVPEGKDYGRRIVKFFGAALLAESMTPR